MAIKVGRDELFRAEVRSRIAEMDRLERLEAVVAPDADAVKEAVKDAFNEDLDAVTKDEVEEAVRECLGLDDDETLKDAVESIVERAVEQQLRKFLEKMLEGASR